MVFGRAADVSLPWQANVEANADFWAAPDEISNDIVAFYRRTWEIADETIASLPLDAIGQRAVVGRRRHRHVAPPPGARRPRRRSVMPAMPTSSGSSSTTRRGCSPVTTTSLPAIRLVARPARTGSKLPLVSPPVPDRASSTQNGRRTSATRSRRSRRHPRAGVRLTRPVRRLRRSNPVRTRRGSRTGRAARRR